MLDSNFSGQELRLFRESQKVSQAKLAKETSIVQAKISSFELDKGVLSDEDKAKIFQFFSNSSKVEKVVKAKKKITKQSNFSISSLDVDERKKKYALSPKNKKYVQDLDTLYDRHLNSNKDFKAISLFSGCGGLCLGFSAAGVRIAGFIEKDKDISQIYRDNFSSTPQLANDITSLSHKDIEEYKESIGDKDRYGMNAVIGPAFVLINRSKQSGETLKEVIFKDGAISSMNHRVNKIVVRNPIDEAAWKTSLSMAKQLLKVSKYPEGVYSWVDPTRGATYYYHKSIRPAWSKEMKLTARLGSHVYRYGDY